MEPPINVLNLIDIYLLPLNLFPSQSLTSFVDGNAEHCVVQILLLLFLFQMLGTSTNPKVHPQVSSMHMQRIACSPII